MSAFPPERAYGDAKGKENPFLVSAFISNRYYELGTNKRHRKAAKTRNSVEKARSTKKRANHQNKSFLTRVNLAGQFWVGRYLNIER